MRERWIGNYYVHRDKILGSKPLFVRWVLGLIIHRKIANTVYLQGVGRYSDGEAAMLVKEIWMSIDGMLVERRKLAKSGEPFWCLGGTQPTEVDASLFGFITSGLVCES
jgi:hypothetical protein